MFDKARLLAITAAVVVAVMTSVSPALAQEAIYARATEGVILPTPWLTAADDATALSINPANMGFLDSWSFVYAGSWLADQRHLAGQGHGLFLAVPLGPFGLGISTEFISESLGHKDVTITETYLDSFENDHKKEIAKHLTAFKK